MTNLCASLFCTLQANTENNVRVKANTGLEGLGHWLWLLLSQTSTSYPIYLICFINSLLKEGTVTYCVVGCRQWDLEICDEEGRNRKTKTKLQLDSTNFCVPYIKLNNRVKSFSLCPSPLELADLSSLFTFILSSL